METLHLYCYIFPMLILHGCLVEEHAILVGHEIENDGCFAFGDCNDVHLINVIMSWFFQAFLTRAAYYGLQGKYSKAILNCNEAIKLQPNSIRTYLYRYHRGFPLFIFSPS